MGFQAGYKNRVFWESCTVDDNGDITPSGSQLELFAFRHSWEESDEGHEVTSSCHEGIQAFIASVLRGQGDASFHTRAVTNAGTDTPTNIGLTAQAVGIFTFQFGNQEDVTLPCYVSRIRHENETAAGTDWQVSFKLNAEAGTYIRGV